MGNSICCEQAKEDLGVNQRLDEIMHQKAGHSSEVKEKQEQPEAPSPRHSHEKVEHEHPSLPIHENKNNIDDILEEVEINDPPNEIVAESEVKVNQEPEHIDIPPLPDRVLEVVDRHRNQKIIQGFFEEQLHHLDSHSKKYHQDVYVGALDHETQRPNGFGKMYKEDGSLFVGHFDGGKAHGAGVFIFPNGSYYKGEFKDNKAEANVGIFKSDVLQYTGGFKSNTFHGLGKQQGPNYEFDGEYNKGTRVKGILKWQAPDGAYEYEGSFNSENKFHATGILREPNGVYEGEFVDGKKHGYGYYRSVSGYIYKGDYTHDARTGKGSISDHQNKLIYEGEVQNGFPHGKGKGFRDGKLVESVWDQGIEAQLIS